MAQATSRRTDGRTCQPAAAKEELNTRDYTRSIALSKRAQQWTPGGSQTLSKASSRFPWGAYPPVLVRGEGCHVWDADGNEFIDLIGSLGATTVGYGHPHILSAVAKQMAEGTIFSLPHPLEGQVAERFCTLLGWPTGCKFAKTGSDCCSMAVRAARAYTGRDEVLVADNGYHGTHDWFTVIREEHPGIPEFMTKGIATFGYNDLTDLRDALIAEKPALVMLEPTLFTPPAEGFLQGVIDLAHQHGALVCFDETILGGRMAVGGGGEYFHVQPDLAVFGKALGGGFPMACVVGARDVIDCAVGFSGTFFGDCIGLAAMNATLDVYRDEPIIQTQWDIGNWIMLQLNAAIRTFRLPAILDGYPIHPRLTFTGEAGRHQMSVFLQEMADHGILWHPSGINIPGRIAEEDWRHVLGSIAAVFPGVCRGYPLRGSEIQDAQIRPAKGAAA